MNSSASDDSSSPHSSSQSIRKSRKKIEKSELPSVKKITHRLPTNHYAKTTQLDLFTFETTLKEMIDRYMAPVHAQAEKESDRVVSTHLAIIDLQK